MSYSSFPWTAPRLSARGRRFPGTRNLLFERLEIRALLAANVDFHTVIEGEVLDAVDGKPIPGATVSYRGASVVSDEIGFYLLDDVDAGTYLVTASAPGYVSSSTTVIVAAEFEATADFALEPARAPALTFIPTQDAHIKSDSQRTNFGSLDHLRIKQDTVSYQSYLKFDVQNLAGTVASAKLRLFVKEAGHSGGAVFPVGNNLLDSSTPWTEENLTASTAPALTGTAAAIAGRVNLGTWVEFDVTSTIAGNGEYSFAIQGLSTGSVLYSSKEGVNPPQLVVETVGAFYRTINGSGNHADHSMQGAAKTDFIRLGYPAVYPDGHGDQIDISGRPNPRDISNRLITQPGPIANDRLLTDWVVQWGQFIAHDLSLATSSPEANVLSDQTIGDFSIPVTSPLDPLGPNPIQFNRSDFDPDTGTPDDMEGRPNWREQINHVTSYLDASQIYGSDDGRAAALRTFEDGKLRISEDGLLPRNTDHWPNDDPFHLGESLFLAGDVRGNEQVGLTAVHILFVREHNRLAERIKAEDPSLNDEQIYQLARKLVGAELQIITYEEYLPAVFGNAAPDPALAQYDPTVDASITNAFATAMFRFGRSMQSPKSQLVDDNGDSVGSLSWRDSFFDPAILGDDPQKVDFVLKGLASQFAQENDPFVVDELRNFLFGHPGAGGMDLAALEIQRGRDHGLQDFNALRESYDLTRVTSFGQISSRPEIQAALQELYGSVDNIDSWVGAIAEDHLPGSSAGPTVTEVVVNQFVRLRDGDQYFFVNDPVLKLPIVSGVMDWQRVTLAEIIRKNTSITNIQDNVFFRELSEMQITSFAPTSGPVGAEVTIRGTGFDSLTSVELNGVPLASWNVDSETQIRVRIPAAATSGPMGVTNPAGKVTSSDPFTVTAVSTIHFPADGGVYNAAGWADRVSGGVTGDGVGSVQVSIRRLSDDKFWGGSAFDQSSERFHPVAGTTNWHLDFSSARLADGVRYTITAAALDTAGTTLSTAAATFTFDSTAPKLTSFSRQSPAICSTDDDVLIFRATFNEPVRNVDAGDFVVKGTTASVTNVSAVDPSTYHVTVSGGNLASLNGTVGLNLALSQDITDLAGNVLPVAAASTDEQFIISNSHSSIVALFQDGMKGYQGTRDTTILGEFPEDARFGTSPKLELDGKPDQISLIRWDTTAIPPSSTVSAVSITYNVVNASVSEYQVYEALRPWDEQTATYLLAASEQPWGAPGAAGATDRAGTALGEFKGRSLGLVTIDLNAAGVAMVQEWVTNPASNFGIVIQNLADSIDDDLDFSSREAGRVLLRPRLIVEFLPELEHAAQHVDPANALHNHRNPFDVNDDLSVTPLDALIVINELNRPAELSGEGEVCVGKIHRYTDVSGDNQVAPTDVLLIFNYLNRPLVDDNEEDQSAGEGQLPEGEAATLSTTSLVLVGPVAIDVGMSVPLALSGTDQPGPRRGPHECVFGECDRQGNHRDSVHEATEVEEFFGGDASLVGSFLSREGPISDDLLERAAAVEFVLREPRDSVFSNWLS
jgi:hypothetical protein